MLYMHIIYSICILYIYYIHIVYYVIYLTQFVLYIYIHILFCILYVACYAVYSCSRASGIGLKAETCLAAVQPPGLP